MANSYQIFEASLTAMCNMYRLANDSNENIMFGELADKINNFHKEPCYPEGCSIINQFSSPTIDIIKIGDISSRPSNATKVSINGSKDTYSTYDNGIVYYYTEDNAPIYFSTYATSTPEWFFGSDVSDELKEKVASIINFNFYKDYASTYYSPSATSNHLECLKFLPNLRSIGIYNYIHDENNMLLLKNSKLVRLSRGNFDSGYIDYFPNTLTGIYDMSITHNDNIDYITFPSTLYKISYMNINQNIKITTPWSPMPGYWFNAGYGIDMNVIYMNDVLTTGNAISMQGNIILDNIIVYPSMWSFFNFQHPTNIVPKNNTISIMGFNNNPIYISEYYSMLNILGGQYLNFYSENYPIEWKDDIYGTNIIYYMQFQSWRNNNNQLYKDLGNYKNFYLRHPNAYGWDYIDVSSNNNPDVQIGANIDSIKYTCIDKTPKMYSGIEFGCNGGSYQMNNPIFTVKDQLYSDMGIYLKSSFYGTNKDYVLKTYGAEGVFYYIYLDYGPANICGNIYLLSKNNGSTNTGIALSGNNYYWISKEQRTDPVHFHLDKEQCEKCNLFREWENTMSGETTRQFCSWMAWNPHQESTYIQNTEAIHFEKINDYFYQNTPYKIYIHLYDRDNWPYQPNGGIPYEL